MNTGQTFGWVLAGQWSGHSAQIASSAAVWIALPLAIGTAASFAATFTDPARVPGDG